MTKQTELSHHRIIYEEGRRQREAEILEMIDKCRAYLHYGIKVIDFKELKSKIKGEKKE